MNADPQPARAPPAADGTEARINFLFRTTQREGRIHPLLHLLQQHRANQAAAAKEQK